MIRAMTICIRMPIWLKETTTSHHNQRRYMMDLKIRSPINAESSSKIKLARAQARLTTCQPSSKCESLAGSSNSSHLRIVPMQCLTTSAKSNWIPVLATSSNPEQKTSIRAQWPSQLRSKAGVGIKANCPSTTQVASSVSLTRACSRCSSSSQ